MKMSELEQKPVILTIDSWKLILRELIDAEDMFTGEEPEQIRRIITVISTSTGIDIDELAREMEDGL